MSNDIQHSAERDLDVARQWIAFLQRRNTVLSIIWPLFLIIALAAVAAGLYLFQNQTLLQTELDMIADKSARLEDTLSSERARSEELETEREQLASELSRIKTNILDEQGLKNEQQRLSEQLVKTLKNKISALEDDGRALEDLLAQKQQEVQALQLANKAKEKVSAQLQEQYRLVSGQLKSSKTAFEALSARQKETRAEVDRLANLLGKNEVLLQQEKKRYQQLKVVSEQRESEFSAMQARLATLEQRLKSLISPIEVEPAATLSSPAVRPINSESVSSANKDSAVSEEEIAFDYESIAIDRP